MSKRSVPEATLKQVMKNLQQANDRFAAWYPGESPARQPVQTVYGGAHLFKAEGAARLGEVALRCLDENAPDFITFAKALQLPGHEKLPRSAAAAKKLAAALARSPARVKAAQPEVWLLHTVYQRVVAKLKHEAVEDFRIDFEDGYGNRPDAEEDRQAAIAAQEVAKGMKAGTLPPFIGIRIKPFTQELKKRAIATLDIFITELVAQTGGKLPENFVITLPKVTMPEHITAAVRLFEALEKKLKLPAGSLKCELMIETTQSIINHEGECNVSQLVKAAEGRCTGAHFGVYDYTASCSITANHQRMNHLACDFARHMMKVSLAGTGIWISDGATNIMPVGPHRAAPGKALTKKQRDENREVVHRAWRIMLEHVNHSLEQAYYQGWDLHPAQFPIRYAAVYFFFLQGLDAASLRLKTFIEKAAQATLIGDVFDDAATGQGLLNYFLRGINCGAITEEEAQQTGLTLDELHARSFVKILETRRMR
ncbi:MAG TPA: phosphoenolpyruvate kinase [Kiritimatiellia bacterium]|nr:phosphoenolpyruvate kinase [Kiritimatiellia bacterium]HMP33683.1 phosphoenolpyruvate kinase [Kiritimatiellia bacterium]